MTYDEYIAQQQQAIDEEQQDDSCFLTELQDDRTYNANGVQLR